jgi:hypothetical protein
MSWPLSWPARQFDAGESAHVPKERLVAHILSGVVLSPTDYGHIEHCVRCTRILADTLMRKLEGQGRGAVSIHY